MARHASAHGHSAWPAEAGATPALALARRRGSATRPAAISGHGRASWRVHGMREKMANAVGQLGGAGEERRGDFHGGRARRRHGRWWRG